MPRLVPGARALRTNPTNRRFRRNRLEAIFDALGGELALFSAGLGQQPLLAAVFLGHFLQRLLDGRGLGFQFLDGRLLGGEVAGNHQRGWDQLGLILQLANGEIGLLLRIPGLVLDDEPGLGRFAPAVAGDHVTVVLHGLGPIVHQVLVHVIGINQSP